MTLLLPQSNGHDRGACWHKDARSQKAVYEKLFASEKGRVLICVNIETLRRLINGYDAVVP